MFAQEKKREMVNQPLPHIDFKIAYVSARYVKKELEIPKLT